ncbi:hypothetical protein PQE20_27425 (plasmid) [Vibrio harveyi]|uniref:hypothetical protein n=1 Tax=Vibrio harveyi TaxID=669 RepID=UPI00234DBA5C|nr:hypothetical protein [Vibrio harveyi]WCP84212.1 hypothetical protein PQE20_27425 [Vibrio harveyi]
MASQMIDESFFERIRIEFSTHTRAGFTRNDIADAFCVDREEFSSFIDSNEEALQEERRAKFNLKGDLLKATKDKGNHKEILKMFGNDQAQVQIEFKRGDMRTPDEIIITNTESHEKKSLACLLSSRDFSKS